ncbi:Protein FAM45A [Fukomys damarensis]|uniref:Protein FAM45A n=1 Tax=Fukomys damarensis TaxID=885580 RepID=A0A091D0U4_FUKDA|nr:Protein FAM45A [Fukomys damarensis]
MHTDYAARFVGLEVKNRLDFCDVFVNLAERDIITAPFAKDRLTMGRLHKDKSDNQGIQDVALKTKEIFTSLAPILEVVRMRKSSPRFGSIKATMISTSNRKPPLPLSSSQTNAENTTET